jgi:hypothetical protein
MSIDLYRKEEFIAQAIGTVVIIKKPPISILVH